MKEFICALLLASVGMAASDNITSPAMTNTATPSISTQNTSDTMDIVIDEEFLENLELFKLANQIRGSNYECEGIKYIKSLQAYQKQLLLAMQEDKVPSAYNDDTSYHNSLEYFRYWGLQSIGNHRLYERFAIAKKEALKTFTQILGYENATHIVQMIEKWAFGQMKDFVFPRQLDMILDMDAMDLEAYIIKTNPDVFALTKALQVSLLEQKDIENIKILIKYGAKINAGYESALFFALDYPKGLVYLLENGANVDYENFFGKTPLFYAVEASDMHAATLLLDYGAKINKELISANELDVAMAHLPYYMKICSFIHGNKNVFLHASAYAKENMLKLLVSRGAKYDSIDDMGFGALDFALLHNNQSAAKYLSTLGLKQNRSFEPMMGVGDELAGDFVGSDDDSE